MSMTVPFEHRSGTSRSPKATLAYLAFIAALCGGVGLVTTLAGGSSDATSNSPVAAAASR